MENSGEFSHPIETQIQPHRQKSLNHQLEKLDQNRPDHQILGDVLKDIYQNYETLDQQASKAENIRYQPKCANKDTTTQTDFGSYQGSYEYVSIVEAIDKIPDPYNIFPKIEATIKDSKGLSNAEIIKNIAETITKNTEIPIVIEPFNGLEEPYGNLENGNIYYHPRMAEALGIHSKQYEPKPDFIDFKNPKGDLVLINELSVDNPAVIKTGLHELGHIVEEKTLDIDQERTEVISSLYGIKAGLLMAEVDPQKSADMLHDQINLYNWILTGTVAP